MNEAPQWIVLAEILRPQGRKGEVLAELLTDFPERFEDHPGVWLAPIGFADRTIAAEPEAGVSPEQASVEAHWLPVGKNAGRIVLHFAGVDSIEKAERLQGREVLIPATDRFQLEEGASYISDLVGSTVYDRDVVVGVVETVQFPTSPDGSRRIEEAAPLLGIMSPEGDELLVPFARDFLIALDLPAKAIRMVLPEGLIDINRNPSK